MRRIITARLERLMCNQNRTLSTLIALQMTHSSLRKSQSFLLFYTLSGVLSHSPASCILFSILWNSMQPICDRDCIICASTQLCKYGPARCKTTAKEKTVSEICSGEKLQLELWVNQSTKSKHTKLHYSEKYWMKRKHISFWLICNACKWTPIKTLLNTKILFLFWFWFRCCCGCLSFFVEIARIFLAFYSLTCIFRLSTILGIVHLMSLYYM